MAYRKVMAECPNCGFQNTLGHAGCPGCVANCPDGFIRRTNLVCGWDQARRPTVATDPLTYGLGSTADLPRSVTRAASASPGVVLTNAAVPTARYRRRGSGSWPATHKRGGWRVPPKEQPPKYITDYCLSGHDLTPYGADHNGNCDRCRAQYIERNKIYTCVRCISKDSSCFFFSASGVEIRLILRRGQQR